MEDEGNVELEELKILEIDKAKQKIIPCQYTDSKDGLKKEGEIVLHGLKVKEIQEITQKNTRVVYKIDPKSRQRIAVEERDKWGEMYDTLLKAIVKAPFPITREELEELPGEVAEYLVKIVDSMHNLGKKKPASGSSSTEETSQPSSKPSKSSSDTSSDGAQSK